MKRLISNVLLRLLEYAEIHTGQRCDAYGGISANGSRVRTCDRPRWHWDSHAYEWRDA